MGAGEVIRSHVESLARGINVANASPDSAGPAEARLAPPR